MTFEYRYDTPVGPLCISEENGYITRILPESSGNGEYAETEIIKKAQQQLAEYFNGTRREFSVPVKLNGTDFQKKVWRELIKIPYGETRSYGEIAEAAGNPKASRAVGGANNKNKILIIVPCHRVIGKNGGLVGFGAGIDMKRFLLNLECRRI